MSTESSPIEVRLRGKETKGRLALIETFIGPDWDGPPLHIHPSYRRDCREILVVETFGKLSPSEREGVQDEGTRLLRWVFDGVNKAVPESAVRISRRLSPAS